MEQRLPTLQPVERQWGLAAMFEAFANDPDFDHLIVDSTIVAAGSAPVAEKRGAQSGHRAFPRRPDDKNPYGCPQFGVPSTLLSLDRSGRRCAQAQPLLRFRSVAIRDRREGAQAVIPNNPSRAIKYPLNKPLYAERHLIECCFSRLKRFRHSIRATKRREKLFRRRRYRGNSALVKVTVHAASSAGRSDQIVEIPKSAS